MFCTDRSRPKYDYNVTSYYKGMTNTPGSVEVVGNAEEVVLAELKGPRKLPQELRIREQTQPIKGKFHLLTTPYKVETLHTMHTCCTQSRNCRKMGDLS